jgi:E3 ubiquitin-protein ligase HECTD2
MTAQPISSSHTAWLVRQCLRSYLGMELGCETSQEDDPNTGVATGEAEDGSAPEHTATPVVSGPNAEVSRSSTQTLRPTPSLTPRDFRAPRHKGFPRENANPNSFLSSSAPRPTIVFVGDSDDQSPQPQSNPTDEAAKRIFKPLEDYIASSFSTFECLNTSFSSVRDHSRNQSEKVLDTRRVVHRRRDSAPAPIEPLAVELDPKLLMVGDIAENGTWWTGSYDDYITPHRRGMRPGRMRSCHYRSLRLDSESIRAWYGMVVRPTEGWREICDEITLENSLGNLPAEKMDALERQLKAGEVHVQKALRRATETLLRRPGRPIVDPSSLRFLLIALHNPLLRFDRQCQRSLLQPKPPKGSRDGHRQASLPLSHPTPGLHSSLLKRILGLLSQSSIACHELLTSWFAQLPRDQFKELTGLVSDFLTYRLVRQKNTPSDLKADYTGGLIPSLGAEQSVSAFHAALEAPRSAAAPSKAGPTHKAVYSDDWQVRAASRVLSMIFAANNRPAPLGRDAPERGYPPSNEGESSGKDEQVRARGQVLPTSDFYNHFVNSVDLIVDFENWEAKRGTFSFCEYPFFMSISAKKEVLEHEARRQMASKARDAFFDSILTRKNVNQYLVLDIRRDCLVEDSLRGVSEVIGSGSEDIKKMLRIAFSGEEGVDHGGLRKEWFLLLIREVFNPDNGKVPPVRGLSSCNN